MRTSLFRETVIAYLLVGLSWLLTGLVIFSFRDLLSNHAPLAYILILPLNIGAHDRVSAAISSSLASGTPLRLDDWLAVVWQACLEDSWMAGCVGMLYSFFAYLQSSMQVGLIVAIALPFIACWRNVLAGLFPLLSVRLGLHPEVTAFPLMATVGQTSGLFLYFFLARVLLHGMPAVK